ncbi:hypothetical protein J6590_103175 [Homalodisca vitripennis]|nr:hypothetical protein J6590_103175 [Homalodisca vitripennis]
MAIKQEKVSKKAGKLASKEKTNEKINSLKVRSKPIVLTCKNQNQGRKFLTFDDSSTSDEDIPEEDSDSVDDICDWPPQPMESDDGIDKPVQAGDFCLTLLSGKKSTRNFVVEVLDVDELANVYSVKYLKKADSTRNNFVYDKDDIFELSGCEIISKLPKPISNSSRDPESDSSSELPDLFGDPSSDEYRPDFDDLSDSDKEEDFPTARARPDKNKLIQNATVIPDSDDDLETLSSNRQRKQQVGEHDLHNTNEDSFSDDVVGPSDEDEGLLRVLQVVNPDPVCPAPPKKRKKVFHPDYKFRKFNQGTRRSGKDVELL